MAILNEDMTYSSDINLEEEISKLLAYMRESGEFSGDAPRLVLIKDDVENARKISGASAFYNPEDKSITLYSEGRHARDLICSYLHELTHYKQDLEGRLNNITTDNITEDENLAELEREAYEFSGMMFRKYKDSKKPKQIQEPLQEVKDKYGLNQFAREIMREIAGEEDQKYQLYCDMDEVLIAFNQGFKNMFGETPSSYEKKYGRAELIAMINKQDEKFWRELGWTQNGKALWNSIKKYNPTIITSPSGKASEIGKQKWIKYNLGIHVPIIFAQADEKANYSGSNKILIDDNTSTIYKWIDKGGIGIHYISAMSVINRLKELGI